MRIMGIMGVMGAISHNSHYSHNSHNAVPTRRGHPFPACYAGHMKKAAIEDRVYDRVVRLAGVGRAVAECFGGTHMPDADPAALKRAVQDLKKAVRALPEAYAVIIGGLAVQEWGYERYTKDIDVVVDAASFDAVVEGLRRLGYEITPERVLRHLETKIEIDLLKEGAQIKGSTAPLPHPRALGPNLGFCAFAGANCLENE